MERGGGGGLTRDGRQGGAGCLSRAQDASVVPGLVCMALFALASAFSRALSLRGWRKQIGRKPHRERGRRFRDGSPGAVVRGGLTVSLNFPEETPNPRRDTEKRGRQHTSTTITHMVSPCLLGASSWVRSLPWGILG